jgi:hypothetical protein
MMELAEMTLIAADIAFPPREIAVRGDRTRAYLQVSNPHGRCNVTGELRP